MSGRCDQCKSSLGFMEDYGSNGIKLCFDCANSQSCSLCGTKTDIQNRISENSKIFCPSCFDNKQRTEAQAQFSETDNFNSTAIHANNEDNGGFFALEKKGMKKGAAGGVLMMFIAVAWFIIGYALGYIFFYPPILFIIGLFTLLKGISTGNYSGQNKN